MPSVVTVRLPEHSGIRLTQRERRRMRRLTMIAHRAGVRAVKPFENQPNTAEVRAQVADTMGAAVAAAVTKKRHLGLG